MRHPRPRGPRDVLVSEYGWSEARVTALFGRSSRVSQAIAAELAKSTGTKPRHWLRLEEDHQLAVLAWLATRRTR
jgi:plasmid maintenance system antidote protein VapI